MKKSREEFILRAHKEACSDWKRNIESEFPKLFKKEEFEVGKWYTDNDLETSFLVCITKIKDCEYYGFGFNGSGIWCDDDDDSWGSIEDMVRPATNKEVEEALTKEAKKRYLNGVTIKSDQDGKTYKYNNIVEYWAGSDSDFLMRCNDSIPGQYVFYKGKWATIVETITKEEAEKQLGKTILN
jgi:hypothetical protein